MKTYKDLSEFLEQDAIEKYFAYAALRTEDPANPNVRTLRKRWQEASNRFRELLCDFRNNRIQPDAICMTPVMAK